MVGQVLDTVLRVIGRVVWFKRHAVITHSVGAMFAKPGMITRDLSVFGAPVFVDGILLDNFPWPGTCGVVS